MSRPIHVTEASGGQTLLAFVSRSFGGDDRAAGLIRQRRVTYNGNLCVDPSRRLRVGDVIKVLPHPLAEPPRASDVAVRYLDEHLVVVEKPSGMTTMRYGDEVSASGRRDRLPTLLELLPGVVAKKHDASGPPPRRDDRPDRRRDVARGSRRDTTRGHAGGRRNEADARTSSRFAPRRGVPRVIPVHRLDRDTSGLMVFALTSAAEAELVRMFRDHEQERVYQAFAVGSVERRTIESYLADDRGDGRRGSIADESLGQRAATHVAPLETLGDVTLVECRLETGRTHQIRIHLAESGHPICGDRVYRGPLGARPIEDRSGAPRLALHAAGLSFRHPITRRPLSFRAPLPKDLERFRTMLRRAGRSMRSADDAPDRPPE